MIRYVEQQEYLTVDRAREERTIVFARVVKYISVLLTILINIVFLFM